MPACMAAGGRRHLPNLTSLRCNRLLILYAVLQSRLLLLLLHIAAAAGTVPCQCNRRWQRHHCTPWRRQPRPYRHHCCQHHSARPVCLPITSTPACTKPCKQCSGNSCACKSRSCKPRQLWQHSGRWAGPGAGPRARLGPGPGSPDVQPGLCRRLLYAWQDWAMRLHLVSAFGVCNRMHFHTP